MRAKSVLAAAVLLSLAGCSDRFSRGPYVLSMSEGRVQVLFRLRPGQVLGEGAVVELLDAAGAVVASAGPELGEDGTFISTLAVGEPARVAGYRLTAGGKPLSRQFKLKLPRPQAPTRVIVYGDTRSLPYDHRAVARALARENGVQGIFHVGDFVSDGTKANQWDPEFFGPAREALRGCPIFPMLGNHEKRGAPFFAAFNMPKTGGYYSRRIGPAQFIVVDQYQQWQEGSEQYAWLEKELSAVPDDIYKFVLFHEPPFSANLKRGHNIKYVRGLVPLLDRQRVDIVFCGHDHHYVRSGVIGQEVGAAGTTYIITGGGGAPRYAAEPDDWTVVTSESLEYTLVDIDDAGRLTITAKDTAGRAFDRYQLPAPRTQRAELALGPMVAVQTARADLQKALEDNLLVDQELAPGQPLDLKISLPLKNNTVLPISVALSVAAGTWKVELPPTKFELEPGQSAQAELSAAHDGAAAPYPTPRVTCTWSVGDKRGAPIEVALVSSVAPTGILASVSDHPTFDGNPNEKFWTSLRPLGYLLREDGKGLASGRTDIYVAAGKDELFVAGICEEDQMEKVRARAAGHDDPNLWADDCIELFLEPVKGTSQYYQMVVSITGYRFDAKGKDASWNADWNAKVYKGRDAWSFEAKIPWKSLGLPARPAPGDKLGFNIGRTRNAVKELSQWSRIPSGDSHTPEKFGTLVVK